MPGKFLHMGCKMNCSVCYGMVMVDNPVNTILKVQGNPVILSTARARVVPMAGVCPGTTMVPPTPCMLVRWTDMKAARTKVSGQEVLLFPEGGVAGSINYVGQPERAKIMFLDPSHVATKET
jgi:hypothetical protein